VTAQLRHTSIARIEGLRLEFCDGIRRITSSPVESVEIARTSPIGFVHAELRVAERHHIRVSAPAEITLAAAGEADLEQSPIARAIFRAREVMLGSAPDRAARPRGLLAWTERRARVAEPRLSEASGLSR